MSTIQSTLKLTRLLASTGYLEYAGLLPTIVKESDYGVSVDREVYRYIPQTDLGVGVDNYVGQLQKSDKDLATTADNGFLVFTPEDIADCISKMRYVDTRCRELCSEANFLNNKDWCLTNCEVRAEDVNVPSKCLRYLYHFLRTQTYLNGGDISVVEQAEPYIQGLPKVKTGDVIDPEHHNAIVDAINSLSYTALGLNTNSFVYLALTNRLMAVLNTFHGNMNVVDKNEYTDKGITALSSYWGFLLARLKDVGNHYVGYEETDTGWRGTSIYLAIELIIDDEIIYLAEGDSPWYTEYSMLATVLKFSALGSMLGLIAYLDTNPIDILNPPQAFFGISASDTTFASGYFGYGYKFYYDTVELSTDVLTVYLVEPEIPGYTPPPQPPQPPSPQSIQPLQPPASFDGFTDPVTIVEPHSTYAVVEVDVVGDGSRDNPIRPNFDASVVVKERYRKLYDVLVNKLKLSEAEAIDVLKSMYRNPISRRCDVNYGAIDYKGTPTMFVVLSGGNVGKYVSRSRSKNMFADYIKPSFDFVKELHRRIRSENKEMLITENELAFQILHRREYEIDAIADFYHREVVDLKRLNPARVSGFDRTIDSWIKKAEQLKRTDSLTKLKKAKKI